MPSMRAVARSVSLPSFSVALPAPSTASAASSMFFAKDLVAFSDLSRARRSMATWRSAPAAIVGPLTRGLPVAVVVEVAGDPGGCPRRELGRRDARFKGEERLQCAELGRYSSVEESDELAGSKGSASASGAASEMGSK